MCSYAHRHTLCVACEIVADTCFFLGRHDPDQVLAARRAVLGHLHDLGGKLDGTQPWEDGVLLQGCGAGCVPFMEGRQPLAEHDPAKRDTVMKVLEGRR